jgi:hypothetical protein
MMMRRGDHADGRDDEQQHAKVPATSSTSWRTSSCGALVLVLADDRDEGLAEGALREQPAQEVRDLERHEPGVHEGAAPNMTA